MFIKKLILKNYRNYSDACFEFIDGVNILYGNNAQGKTNCAEAIFYLCTGYSPRVTRDKQVIKYGEELANISAVANSRYGNVYVEIDFTNAKKTVKVNGAPISKIGELMGNINSVFFNPSELKLIQEAPEDRRRFMDIAISQINKSYFYALQKYKKILDERNNLLKLKDKESILETIYLWNEKLSEYAQTIILERQKFLKGIEPLCKEIHQDITGGEEEISVIYESALLKNGENVKQNMLEGLNNLLDKDIILGYTTLGPHRDDIKIKVNGIDVRTYGSQGQQRTSALSLKLAELECYKNTFKEYPVLILDDAFSELDKDRRFRLANRIKNIQTIITCTDLEIEAFSSANTKIFKIDNGGIVETF